MPFEFGLWRIDESEDRRIPSSTLNQESRLQSLLEEDPNMLERNLLILGSEVNTESGNAIDLLGIDADGDLHVIELKRGRSPRQVVAQILDYAAWVRSLGYEEVKEIYEDADSHGESFELGYERKFNGIDDDDDPSGPDTVNDDHYLLLVSSELDSTSERIIDYLSEEYELPINALRFNYFADEDREYIARTWLRDPDSVKEDTDADERSWNGVDFYANFGVDSARSWEDAQKYGFVAGGGGEWYQHGMNNPYEGARVFVYIPDRADAPTNGYVGVGVVTQPKTPVTDFEVEVDDEPTPILNCDLDGDLGRNKDDPSLREYLIGVDWIKTVPLDKAYREAGMYSNQHTVTRFRDGATLDKLCEHFDVHRNYSADN